MRSVVIEMWWSLWDHHHGGWRVKMAKEVLIKRRWRITGNQDAILVLVDTAELLRVRREREQTEGRSDWQIPYSAIGALKVDDTIIGPKRISIRTGTATHHLPNSVHITEPLSLHRWHICLESVNQHKTGPSKIYSRTIYISSHNPSRYSSTDWAAVVVLSRFSRPLPHSIHS